MEARGRLLACEFHIAGDHEPVARALAGLAFHAVQTMEPTRRHRLELVPEGGGYRIREDGQPREHTPDPESAGHSIRDRVQALALAALAGEAKIHAGLAVWRGRGILFAGAGRSGKTTLMTRLLYEGFEVQGDDMVIVRDGRAMAFPRRFGVRRGTLDLVPQLSLLTPPWAADLPPNGFDVLAIDPAELGFPWRIAPVPVDHVFFLEPAHGSPSRATPCPRYRMAHHLMTQSVRPADGPRSWIREIATLVARAGCHLLAIGELDSAVAAVNAVLRDPLPAPAGAATPGASVRAQRAGQTVTA